MNNLIKKNKVTIFVIGMLFLIIIGLIFFFTIMFWIDRGGSSSNEQVDVDVDAHEKILEATSTQLYTPQNSETNTPKLSSDPNDTQLPTSTSTSLPPTIIAPDGATMILIPAGPFEMGSEIGESDESPMHTVTLDAFYIDQYEVTQAQYVKCWEADACDRTNNQNEWPLPKDYENYPVNFVTWNHAKIYCEQRGGRLPTEAEWEKAARGTDGRNYPWGNQNPPSSSNEQGTWEPIDSNPDNVSPFGVYNMVGNVWEWIADWYDKDYYSRSPSVNPTGPSSGTLRVVRGGAWQQSSGAKLNAADRAGVNPIEDEFNLFKSIGFRCAFSP